MPAPPFLSLSHGEHVVRPLVIGVTGGIGTGKSAVCELFARHGVETIDADVIAREVVTPGEPALREIVDIFGASILTDDGILDRKKLRALVFQDAARRQQLEAILHPRIRDRMSSRLAQQTGDYCLLCVPLLLETGESPEVDRVLVVDSSPEKQRERASARDGTLPEEVERIIQAQMPREQRLAKADDIIDNEGDLEHLGKQVQLLHEKYLALSRSRFASED